MYSTFSIFRLMCFFFLLLTFPSSLFAQEKGKTIVLIHGLFQNSHSWQNWKLFFEAKGYTVYAPSFPYHQGEPQVLQKEIDPELVNLDFPQVLDYMLAYVDSLPEKPIVIGHSIGGLLTQKLVEMEKASMGITLASANPRGISVLNWKYIRSNFRMVNPLRSRNKVCQPPMRWFKYTFFNTLSDSAAISAHQTYFIPESRIIAKTSTQKGMEIDFEKAHVPMLFIAGEKDNDLPPPLIRKNFEAYQHEGSNREYYTFPKRSHYIASEPGWEEVAIFVEEWIKERIN
ncbi:alpha/beta hydrolase [Pararhodonellum marinum]|uniref:alpha/beta hydrolase n=1 Tax=Pararhodonellum marinum TaxID=2755358 RepID=UPI0018909AFC|nr:alpha/beta hydrolase [Pararhodonellum marinum]